MVEGVATAVVLNKFETAGVLGNKKMNHLSGRERKEEKSILVLRIPTDNEYTRHIIGTSEVSFIGLGPSIRLSGKLVQIGNHATHENKFYFKKAKKSYNYPNKNVFEK